MFAYAASHLDPLNVLDAKVGAARAEDYAAVARRTLDTMYHESRSSTVQALILLGSREFGIGMSSVKKRRVTPLIFGWVRPSGSLEEGWLHIGMCLLVSIEAYI